MRRKKQMNSNQFNKQKGITLIALVITIIVLLILAAVSIATLIGDNGILTQANNSKVETRGAAVQEERDLWVADKEASKYSNGSAETLEQLINRLVEQSLLTEDEKDLILGNDEKGIEATGQVTIGSRTIVFGTGGTTLVDMFLAGKDCTEENCQNPEHLHIGDYVTYRPKNAIKSTSNMTDNPLQEQYTGTSEEQVYEVDENMKWRVLGLNEEEKQILLISETPIKKKGEDPYLKLQGAEGYIYGEKVLNKICEMYSNSDLEATARSITMEDITNALGITINKENNTATNSSGEQLKDMEEYQGFFGIPYNYKAEDYAPENYMIEQYGENLKEGLTEKKVGDSAKNILDDGYDNSAYMINYGSPNVVDPNSKLYEMLFKGTTGNEGYAKSYYVASSGVFVDAEGGGAYFGPGVVAYGRATAGGTGLFYSDGGRGAFRLAVRPIVTLGANISEGDIEIQRGETPDGEDIWNGITNNSPFSSIGDASKGQITE